MVWNTNDWNTEEEDKHWEMTEDDTDDEYDDIALSRLGIEVPDFAKEQNGRTPTSNMHIHELIRHWQEQFDTNPEAIEAFQSMIDENGTIHFGDEPLGIDPIRAGFEGTEEILSEIEARFDSEPNPEPPTIHREAVCAECGQDEYDCECDLWF